MNTTVALLFFLFRENYFFVFYLSKEIRMTSAVDSTCNSKISKSNNVTRQEISAAHDIWQSLYLGDSTIQVLDTVTRHTYIMLPWN